MKTKIIYELRHKRRNRGQHRQLSSSTAATTTTISTTTTTATANESTNSGTSKHDRLPEPTHRSRPNLPSSVQHPSRRQQQLGIGISSRNRRGRGSGQSRRNWIGNPRRVFRCRRPKFGVAAENQVFWLRRQRNFQSSSWHDVSQHGQFKTIISFEYLFVEHIANNFQGKLNVAIVTSANINSK